MSKDDIPETLWSGRCPGHLLTRAPVRVRTAIGEEYEISETAEGHRDLVIDEPDPIEDEL